MMQMPNEVRGVPKQGRILRKRITVNKCVSSEEEKDSTPYWSSGKVCWQRQEVN